MPLAAGANGPSRGMLLFSKNLPSVPVRRPDLDLGVERRGVGRVHRAAIEGDARDRAAGEVHVVAAQEAAY